MPTQFELLGRGLGGLPVMLAASLLLNGGLLFREQGQAIRRDRTDFERIELDDEEPQ